MKIKMLKSKKPSIKKATLLALILVILLSGSVYALWREKRSDTSKTEDSANVVGAPPTYTTEAEGQEIKVPEGVPKEAIKNYELITENEQFKIRKLGDTYTITLYAIINRPEQYDYYQDQLREYKQNALDYLRNNNVNPESVEIIYEPDEAKNL